MHKLERAFYHNTLDKFLSASRSEILGILAQNNHFELSQEQRNAWLTEIDILQKALSPFSGQVFFEFAIPRMGKRADVILLIQQSIFVVEFKVGSHSFDRHALDQVTDYALDLKNFHAGSVNQPIYPILLATAGNPPLSQELVASADAVYAPLLAAADSLRELLAFCLSGQSLDGTAWQASWPKAEYHPTPTIIEAAQALYAGHSVSEISRSDAGAINLSQTTVAVKERWSRLFGQDVAFC